MGLIDLYRKFQEIKTWLAGPGADALERAIEINDKITDAMRQVHDYLRDLDGQGGFATASMSVEDTETIAKIEDIKKDLEAMVRVRPEEVRTAALPPGLRDLLVLVATELIRKLLDRFGGASAQAGPAVT